MVELDPTRGSEIRKTRPVIVINAALERFKNRLGRITENQLEEIISGVAIVIGF